MRTLTLVTTIAVLTAATPVRTAQPAAQSAEFDALVSLVERKMTELGVPGVAFGVVKDGTVRTRALGVTNVDNPQPVTADTVFALASITKTVVATAIMRLVERGKLDLEGLTLERTHAIGHRGVNETMPDVPILTLQPDAAAFLGTYQRRPSRPNVVRLEDGQLRLDTNTIAFYAPDRAIVTSGTGRGNPIEFIRDSSGAVRWIRYIGRIARKQ